MPGAIAFYKYAAVAQNGGGSTIAAILINRWPRNKSVGDRII